MTGAGTTDRIESLRSLLAREGLSVPVSLAGPGGEIAVVRSDLERRSRLAQLAPDIRALGFRYVAIELDPPTEPGAS